jgi:hypothetical protein
MRKLYKLVCERCFVMYGAGLEQEGLLEEPLTDESPLGGICSMCGRVEGHRTVQFSAAEIAAAAADAKRPNEK